MKIITLHHYNAKRQIVAAFKEGDLMALEVMALELSDVKGVVK